MVPLTFHDFFTGCATIAGALIGLLFVALSVSAEYLTGANARIDHQVRAAAAFSALVNTLVLSLFALLPGTDLGTVAIVLATVGLGTMIALVIALAREGRRFTRGDFYMFLILLVLYGLQLANAIRLEQMPHRVNLVVNQGELAVCFFLFGIARAWQLVGARDFGLVSAAASMIHRPAGNGPSNPAGNQPGNPGAPPPEDPGTGHASA